MPQAKIKAWELIFTLKRKEGEPSVLALWGTKLASFSSSSRERELESWRMMSVWDLPLREWES